MIGHLIKENFVHALIITVFVFSMMVLIDAFNVILKGQINKLRNASRFLQYVIASFLGATPGCLGAFLNVTLYIHGLLSFGAITGSMIATSGDEAYVMFAMFPKVALLLTLLLFILGIFFGWLTDIIAEKLQIKPCEECKLQVIHTGFVNQRAVSIKYLGEVYLLKIIFITISLALLLLNLFGLFGPKVWNTARIGLVTLLSLSTLFFLFASRHYLESHIWKHIISKHIWRVFLWTFGTLVFVALGLKYWNLKEFLETHKNLLLLFSAVIGIIPESGPHLIFVTLFSKGLIPFSILFTSSFVQDGHGLLPLLSYSISDSLKIKAFNFVFGLLLGYILFWLGF